MSRRRTEMLALAAAAAIAAGYTFPILRHFKASEFGLWYPFISGDLLLKLDELRERWGRPIMVSPAEGGIGRINDSRSQHNLLHTGFVIRAVDIFPEGSAPDGDLTVADRNQLRELAKEIGFTGIGFYTDTEPSIMMHVDVRPGDHVAEWSRIAGVRGPIGDVLT